PHEPWGIDEQPLYGLLLAAELHTEIELIGYVRPLRDAGHSLDAQFAVHGNAVDAIIRGSQGELKGLTEFCHRILGTWCCERQGSYQIARCHRFIMGRALDQERPY